MDVDQQALHIGLDSWEGTMTYRGITFMVEATAGTHNGACVWEIEVLRQTGWHMVQPLSYTYYPTLDAGLEAAECTIRQLVDYATL